MSLEQDITELTKTASGLIDSFQQKEQAIEQKIADILPDAVEGLNSFVDVEFYVDAVAGSDANDGLTPESAMQTLDGVDNKLPRVGIAKINLKKGQRHTFQRLSGLFIGNISISLYGNEEDSVPVLQCLPSLNSANEPIIFGIVLRLGQIYFNRIVLDCTYSGSETLSRDSGLVGYTQGMITVSLYDSKVLLSGHPLTAAFAGYRGVNLSLVGTQVNRGAVTSNNVLIKSKSTSNPLISLNLTSATFTGATTDIASLLPTDAGRANIFANEDV